jgi:hypothetical protein
VHEELINVPLVEALERLSGRDVFVRVLAPPQPAIGKGTLHVVRVQNAPPEEGSSADKGERIELTVTYDDYEKLPATPAKAHKDS